MPKAAKCGPHNTQKGSTKQKINPPRDTINNPFPALSDLRRTAQDNDIIYFYVVETVKYDPDRGLFEQTGSGPNLDGGIISLCTCKHYMRTYSTIKDSSKDLWIAGFSGINEVTDADPPANFLYYLMKVTHRFSSHADAWFSLALSQPVKDAKNTTRNDHGDLYQPQEFLTPRASDEAKLSPDSYYEPIQQHPHWKNHGWHEDVSQIYKKPSVLLFGDPKNSRSWDTPLHRWDGGYSIGRGARKLPLTEFLDNLSEW